MKQMKINALNQLILYSISKKDRMHPSRLKAKIALYLFINPTLIVSNLFKKMDPSNLFRKSKSLKREYETEDDRDGSELKEFEKKNNKYMNIKSDSFLYEEEKIPNNPYVDGQQNLL